MNNEIYQFIGEGSGVPGLPHEISRAQAQADGVEKLLNAAITAGNYRRMDASPTPKKSKEVTDVTDGGSNG